MKRLKVFKLNINSLIIIGGFFLFFLIFFENNIQAQAPYRAKNSYVYTVTWKHIPTSRTFDDLVILNCKRGRINRFQRKIEWIYYPNLCADSIIITNIQELFSDSVCNNKLGCQKNLYLLNKMYIKAKTGVSDTKKETWIHPPRSKYYKLFELSPFPWFVKDKKEYAKSLKLGDTWGVFSNSIVSSKYVVQKLDENFIIHATATCIKGKTEATFIYKSNKGFISCNYNFFNVYLVNMVLQ